MASRPEAHTLFSVVAFAEAGTPAASAACRAGACPALGLHDVAHDHLVDRGRVDTRTVDGGAHGVCSQICRWNGGQSTHELANRCSSCAENVDPV